MPINQQTAEEAFNSVLRNAGATLPKRDTVDPGRVEETRTGSATHEGVYKTKKRVVDKTKVTGIIDSQKDVGGWPDLKSVAAPKDSDHDGMPDDWEAMHRFDSNDANDRNKVSDDGYKMLEKYLNSCE